MCGGKLRFSYYSFTADFKCVLNDHMALHSEGNPGYSILGHSDHLQRCYTNSLI